MTDARFEDAGFADVPLRLAIESPDDVPVVSALLQDAVGLAGEITWMPRRHRLTMLLNRFRWEDHAAAERDGRAFERVRSALIFDGVLHVKASGLDPRERETIFSLLQITFEPGEDGAGRVVLALAGDGALALDVECLDARLIDLTRPWEARAGKAPDHDLGD